MKTSLVNVAATVACLMASAASVAQQPPTPSVTVGAATEETMASTFLAPGTVVSRNDARISAEIAGRLTWVAEVGTMVAQGDPLARIDDKAWQLQLQENAANIRRLQANQEYISAQLVRLEKLALQNNAAATQLDESRAQLEMGKQEIVRAQVTRDQTLYQIERTQLVAPFAGRVTERFASIGEYTAVAAPVLRLVDTANVEVRAQAPVAIARYLTDGMPVTVRDDRGDADSSIRSVIGVGDERSRQIEIRVALDGGGWIIGSAVRVALPQSEPTVVVAVPRDALILRQDSTYLYKVMDDNTVQQVPVRTGIGSGALIQVQGDVAGGDQVVIRGGERLRPGQSVVIAQDS